jgi:hypothetical protein
MYKSELFPSVDIRKQSNKSPRAYKDPFQIPSTILNIGDYRGKTFDEIFEIDPGYLFRFSYYWSNAWTEDHKALFLLWTRSLSEK